MPLVIVAIGVALLLLLMIRFKMNGFIALVLVALAVGLMQGMPLDKVIVSIKNGVGGTLGSLALIMGFGAMLGKLLADCGGAQRIATTLINKFGKKHIQWAVVLTGFTVGFALFYEVGFVLMLPLVFTIAASARIPLLYVGVPMAAALSVTHGFCRRRIRVRPRSPPSSMPIWAKRCSTAPFWLSRRLSWRDRCLRAS